MKLTGFTPALIYALSAVPHTTARIGTVGRRKAAKVPQKKKSIATDYYSMLPAHEVHLPKRAGHHHEIEEKERIDVRIVGGTEVDEADRYPFFVSWNGDCGGSLIHSDIVLTAAHCAGIDSDKVVVNAYKLEGNTVDEGGTVVRNIAQKSIHPDYDDSNVANDFLLLKLESPIISINPIPISAQSSSPVDGDELKVIGLGLTSENGFQPDFLRQVEVTAISDASCDAKYSQYGGIEKDVMFCAGSVSGGKDSCQGDSGGPIFTYDPNNSGNDAITQVGVVSWGIGCADARFPGVYAEIGAVRDWIDEEICRLSSDKPASCGGGGGPPEPPSGDKAVVAIDILTDDYPGETYWILSDSAGNVIEQDNPIESKLPLTLYSVYVEVDKGAEYQFEISDTAGDGICCDYGDGAYEVSVDGQVVGSGGVFGESQSFTFDVPADETDPPTSTDPPTNTDPPSSQCENSSNRILIDATVGEQTCDWLSDNIGYYKYLCQFLEVAVTCPLTCDACNVIQTQN